MGPVNVSIVLVDSTKGRKGRGTYPGTDEGDLFSVLILTDDERASVVLGIQHSSELEDPQILVVGVLDGGNKKVEQGCDLVSWSREEDLKTTSGANRGLGVGTDGRETESNKRREHGDAKRFKDTWIKACVLVPGTHPFIPLG